MSEWLDDLDACNRYNPSARGPQARVPTLYTYMSTYAIISVGGKQYRVREGEKLLVDRLAHGEGKSFSPAVLLVGGGGETHISPTDITVTARVVADVKGEKIRIGKYRPKNGYKKHTGFRASLSQIEIESIGGKKRAPAKTEPKTETKSELRRRRAKRLRPRIGSRACRPATRS